MGTAMDPISIAMLGGSAAANFLGSLFGNRSQNKQREQTLQQMQQAAEYFRSQGITDPQAFMSEAYNPLFNFSQGVLGDGNMASWLNDYLAQLRGEQIDQRDSIQQRFMMPGDLQQYYQSPLGDVGRSYDDVNNFIRGQLFDAPLNPAYGAINDRMTELVNGQNQGQDALLQRGNNLLDQWGTTGDNVATLDRAGNAMASNGFTPQGQQFFDAGNALFSNAGMTPQIQQLLTAGQGAVGNGGFSPQVQQLFNSGMGIANSGGYTPNLSAMSQQGTQGLNSFMPGGANAATQGSQLGQYGDAAMQQLLTPASRNIDAGYTPQNLGVGEIGFQGLQQLLARDPQLDQASAFGQQAFSGRLPQGSSYDDILSGLVSRMSSGGGGISVGGGGGAGGASAGGLLPVDPEMAAMIAKGKELFLKDPLIPIEQRKSMAIDEAGSAAAQQAEAAQRFARARGGGGAIVNSGSQNQAMVDFANQAMRAKAEALRAAILDQQKLGLEQQLGAGQIGIAAQNADTNRQQVAASRDIATANNSTQASIANASTSNQAAIANAQIQAAMQQAAMQAALGARGQEYGQSQAGLQAMLAAQQIANDRGGIFNEAMLGGLNDATQRYGVNAQLAASLAGSDAQRQAAALSGALGASGQANQYNLGMSELLAQLGLGAEQQATTRQGQGLEAAQGAGALGVQQLLGGLGALGTGAGLGSQNIGTGMNAMGTASGQANQALGTWGQIQQGQQQDQLSRMGLGANMVQNNIGNQLNAANTLGQNANAQTNGVINLGQLWNQTQGAQGGIWNQMFQNDLANRQLGLNAYTGNNQFGLGVGNLGGSYAGLATNPLLQIGNGMVNYMGQQQGNYAGVLGGMNAQAPKQQLPWPQININPSEWGIGGQQQYGGMPAGFGGYSPQLPSLGVGMPTSPTTPPFVMNPPIWRP